MAIHLNATDQEDELDMDDIELKRDQVDVKRERAGYDDFSTIDWNYELAKDRTRQRAVKRVAESYIWGPFYLLYDSAQGWLIILLVGIMTGWIAGFIDIATEWLSDLKSGYCSAGFYLNRKFCCWLVDPGGVCEDWIRWDFNGSNPFSGFIIFTMLSGLFALISSLLVKKFARYAAGSGIPEVKTILSGFIIKKFFSVWTLLIKVLGLCLSVASGLTLGKEGPLVHVACCLGYLVPNIFRKYKKNEAKKREILSASSAAGVSVAFGAPIGGVLFSLEEVSYYFPYKTMWRSFVCAMVAAISLQVMNPFRTGKLVLFQVTYDRDWHRFELPFFVLLGIFGGVYGSYFIKANLAFASFRRSSFLKNRAILEVVSLAIVTAVCTYPFSLLRDGSVDLVALLFHECKNQGDESEWLCGKSDLFLTTIYLLFAALLKSVLTVFTFGSRVPAGIFIPSMCVGACVGRLLGILIFSWQRSMPKFWMFSSCAPEVPCITPGTYALVGAASTLAGVTRMTVSLTVIMFELTGALSYVLPIMVSTLIAKLLADYLHKGGIYDCLIQMNGYPFMDNRDDFYYTEDAVGMGVTTAGDVMTKAGNLNVISENEHNVDAINNMLRSFKFKGYPIVSSLSDMNLVGYAGRAELAYSLTETSVRYNGHLRCRFSETEDLPSTQEDVSPDMPPTVATDSPEELDFRSWVDQTPITVHPNFPIEMVAELFKKMGLRYILITQNGKLKGLITKKDILKKLGGRSYHHHHALLHPELVLG